MIAPIKEMLGKWRLSSFIQLPMLNNGHQIPKGTLQNFASNIKDIWETLLISIHPEMS